MERNEKELQIELQFNDPKRLAKWASKQLKRDISSLFDCTIEEIDKLSTVVFSLKEGHGKKVG